MKSFGSDALFRWLLTYFEALSQLLVWIRPFASPQTNFAGLVVIRVYFNVFTQYSWFSLQFLKQNFAFLR